MCFWDPRFCSRAECPPPPQKPGPVGTFWIPWTFRYVLDEDGDEDENEDENVKLDFFQCETGMVSMWNWICSNVKLDLFQCENDLFQCEIRLKKCEIGFVLIWTASSLNVKFDWFHCEMGILQMWTGICSNVKLDLFWFEIEFILMLNWISSIA